jgi:formyl-CoA transferase
MSEAIAGIRVLELGQVIAGPFCGQLLGLEPADIEGLRRDGVI